MQSTLEKFISRGENCPLYRLLGIKIEEVKDGFARLSIEVEKKHTQIYDTVHGGVIATLADSASAWAIFGKDNVKANPVTLEMKINFLKPVCSGKLVAEARSVHDGSRIFVSDVEVKNEGSLVAKSLITYYLMKENQPSNENLS
jgi:acyl-CoA thioesterase